MPRTAVLAMLLSCAACQTPPPIEPPTTHALVVDHAVRVQIDNDSIGLGDSQDKAYTNGIQLSWTPPMTDPDSGAARLLRSLPLLPAGADAPHVTWMLGQQMFTPEDIEDPALIVEDRPYAGWLFVGVAARNVQLAQRDLRNDRLDEWRLDVGIVGPSSGADRTQIEWHRIIDTRTPRGWSNQLQDEPGVVLSYRQVRRAAHAAWNDAGLASDALIELRGRLGNVHTDAGLGAAIRFGWNLPRDFGTAARPVRRSRDGAAIKVVADPVPWSLTFVAGVRGDLVIYNIFLDGNTYQSSHSVDRNEFVADLHAGLELRCGEHVRVSYTHVLRTPEFDSDVTENDLQDFASLQLMVDF